VESKVDPPVRGEARHSGRARAASTHLSSIRRHRRGRPERHPYRDLLGIVASGPRLFRAVGSYGRTCM